MAATSLVPEWYTDDTLYRDLPLDIALGPNGSREVYINSKEQKLASYLFPSKGKAKALVILVHGHGCSLQHEYLFHKEAGKPGVYAGSLVELLNNSGIAAAGIDMQGCGHSEGLRCYVDRYQDYVDEVLGFTRSLEGRQGFGGVPIFVAGVSLGGCISVDLCRQTDVYKGAILVAPMLSLDQVSKTGLNPYLRPLAGLLSWLLPTARIAKTEKNDLYPDIQAFFDQDPQTWKEWTRARNAYEYLTTTEALCAAMPEMTFPFVCFHGDIDTMTDPEGSKRLYELSKAEDKELRILPGRWHVLFKESGAQEIYQQVAEWISKRA